MVDSLRFSPAALASEMVQKKSEKELLMIFRDGKSGTWISFWKGELS